MTFKVEIKNIGKLTDAEIHIGGFTVLAGPNNTGKSFVSKLLYSLFDAMNANHAEVHIDNLVIPVKRALARLGRWMVSDVGGALVDNLEGEVNKLKTLVKLSSIDELDRTIPTLIHQTTEAQDAAADIQKFFLEKMEQRKQIDFGETRQSLRETTEKRTQIDLENMMNSLAELKETLSQMDAKKFIVAGVRYKIRQNLIQNFQVPRLSDLRGEESTPSKVNVENFGEFQFSNGKIEFNIKPSIKFSWARQLQRYSRVIYLESPVYWKLKNALEDTRDYPGHSYEGNRERLSGVPGYFHDLVRALRFEYTGDMAFPDVYEKLTGKDVIGGKIAISESGNLLFQEKGRNFSLPVTAMGIANLGILALLIERKVLDEGTFLFIDEPEAHLHPAWQVIMAETLFELSRRGVHVVIATHSVDILQWLEVHVKKNPEAERLIALNQFPANGDKAKEDFEAKMGKITHELTKPFSDLYLEGL